MGAVIIGRPPAAGGGALHEHIQSVAAATWTVDHNLGVKPVSVAVLTDDFPDQPAFCDLSFPDSNTVVITLDVADTGRATIG